LGIAVTYMIILYKLYLFKTDINIYYNMPTIPARKSPFPSNISNLDVFRTRTSV
jgi:hypothetical protein